MLDLDSTSVCEECAMMCTELQYEDGDEDLVVYGDQETNTEEYEKATYGDLTKTQREEEDEVKYNVAQSTNNSVLLERKRRQLNESIPDEEAHGFSQSDTSINEKHTENSFNKVTTVVQGPSDDNDENKSWKVWTMEMLMNNVNISMSMMNEPEQVSKEDKKFLDARAVHIENIYSGIVSLRNVMLVIFLGKLNNLDLWGADIENGYQEAFTDEKLYIVAGPEFQELEGYILIFLKALYGLKSSGKRWAEVIHGISRDIKVLPSKADPCIWLRKAPN